jgi:phosphoglycolate phosphatase
MPASRRKRPLIRLVAFDANGTLLDDAPFMVAALNAVFLALGRPALPSPEVARRLGVPWTGLYRQMGISPDEISDQELGRLYREAYLAGPVPTLATGAEAAIRGLVRRGLMVTVLSAQEEALTRRQLTPWPALLTGLSEVCGGVSDKTVALRDLAARQGLDPTELAYVGDQVSDMTAAKAAGGTPIGRAGGLHPAWRLRRAGAKIVVADLTEIPDLVAPRNPASFA